MGLSVSLLLFLPSSCGKTEQLPCRPPARAPKCLMRLLRAATSAACDAVPHGAIVKNL